MVVYRQFLYRNQRRFPLKGRHSCSCPVEKKQGKTPTAAKGPCRGRYRDPAENHLYGDLDGTFNLQISSTSQVDSLGDDLTPFRRKHLCHSDPPLPRKIPQPPPRDLPAVLGRHPPPMSTTTRGLGSSTCGPRWTPTWRWTTPHAGDYYSWEAQLSPHHSDGRQLTLTPLPDTPGENPKPSPPGCGKKRRWEVLLHQQNLETASSYDTFAFAITNTAHPEEPNYQEEYGLYGSLDGVLTLTCRETVDGSTKELGGGDSLHGKLPGREGKRACLL